MSQASCYAPSDRARSTGPALEAMGQFVRWLIPTLEKFHRSQKFLLADRIQTAALDVLERLIEATYARAATAPLVSANLGLQKLRLFLRLAHDLGHLNFRRYDYAARELDGVGRLIGAWIKTGAGRAHGAQTTS